MAFDVLNPGMLTTIQDAGRFRLQHLGITTGGPMDEHAYYWANRLLGNDKSAAQLEITYGGLKLKALADTRIAITGADLDARLNDQPMENWQTHALKAGDIIHFRAPKSGMRAYLAVQQGFQVDDTLGSVATVTRDAMGGLDGNGQKLQKGDQIPYISTEVRNRVQVPYWAIPDYEKPLTLGVVPGYQYQQFSSHAVMTFFSESYQVTSNIDRMGYRLSGKAIASGGGIISEGIAFGAIQIPQDGQPIVLMKDRQTIGGYPKLGCITALGAGMLSQRPPGSEIRFKPMDISEAEAERMIFNRQLGL